MAHDGAHEAFYLARWSYSFFLRDVDSIERRGADYYINTGTDHHVRFVKGLAQYPVVSEGRAVRHSADYPRGTNVNFVEVTDAGAVSSEFTNAVLRMKLFPVAQEQLLCIGGSSYYRNGPHHPLLSAPGGELEVAFVPTKAGGFSRYTLLALYPCF